MSRRTDRLRIIVAVCFCAGIIAVTKGHWHDGAVNSDSLSRELERLTLQPLADVESGLKLGDAVDMRPPVPPDPYWWFSYIKDGRRVQLAANRSVDDGTYYRAMWVRGDFRYCGLYWIEEARECGSRHLDEQGRASKTFEIRAWDLPRTMDPRAHYLQSIDMTTPHTIGALEAALGLREPIHVDPPSFLSPMHTLTYETDDGFIIRLSADDNSTESGDFKLRRHEALFTGYWAKARAESR